MEGSFVLEGDVLEIELENDPDSYTKKSVSVVFIVEDDMPEIDTTDGKGMETLDYEGVRKFFRGFEYIFDIF